MKKIIIKVPGKMILKDCSWLIDETFRFVCEESFYKNKEIEIIQGGLDLRVFERTGRYWGTHDLQIKIIETGEKFYTRTEFVSHGEAEKVLLVPETLNKNCDIHRCNDNDCGQCFFSYANQKLWSETL